MEPAEAAPQATRELAEPPSGSRTTWAWVTSTFFGAGLLKPGPGTWGSVAATLLWLLARYGLHLSGMPLVWTTGAGVLVATASGIPAGSIVARESGRDDPGHVVIDEVAGVWLALLACAWPVSRAGVSYADWRHALAALLFFRLFDILKPPPARQLESLHGGIGIMLDDLAAGAYAAIATRLLAHWV